MKDFFVSYNSRDRNWAEWIAWVLEEAGYSVVIQAWDFRPGGNFVLDMQRAATACQRTLAVLSEDYLQAAYTQPEWAAAFAQDPQSLERALIPIRVGECTPTGMLRPLVYVDLVGLSEAEARQRLQTLLQERAKPATQPAFPGAAPVHQVTPVEPTFPGAEPSAPPEPGLSLGVYGWEGPAGAAPTVALDWQGYCDRTRRQVPDPATWDRELFPQLQQAKQALAQASPTRDIELWGLRPLTMSLAIGFAFPYVAGYQFRLQQPTGGQTALWHTSAPPSAAQLKVCREQGTEGDDLIVALGISTDAWADVSALHKTHPAQFNALVYIEPTQGAGPQALSSAGDAVALAQQAKELIRQYRRRYAARQVHLILVCPAAFAVFLGQQLNAVGQILAYERTADGGYQPSVQLRTG